MNGVLNTGLEFWQLIVAILAVIFGAIAVKISFNFDINRYLENREKSNMQKIKNVCPHFEMIPLKNNQIEARSLFISPPGTLQHQCRRCGLITYLDIEQHERQAEHYLKNPDEYLKANKKFSKLLKKSGQT
jgi:hypothetical protein